MRVYARIFYAFYHWQHTLFGEGDGPEYSAALGLSLLAVINLTTLALLAQLPLRALPRETWVLAFAILVVVHWFAFVRHGRYRELPEQFGFPGPTALASAKLEAAAYAVASVLLFLGSLVVSPAPGIPAA